jgi:hypothetical protein
MAVAWALAAALGRLPAGGPHLVIIVVLLVRPYGLAGAPGVRRV